MFYGFLLGVIATSSLAAGLFFLKFWKRTRDSLFLTFGIAFIVEGANRIGFMFLDKPSEGSPVIYIIRLGVFLLILGAILKKNYGTA
jgi:uncharacterized membrane protein HdeD (DUF308 family)